MTQHEALTFAQGDEHPLPGTLSGTRSLKLVDLDAATGTAVFELHNPEAEPDTMVAGLIHENLERVEHSNELRDVLHLPEHPVPVDTSTMAVEVLHCKLDEKLQIGDRVWSVSAIADDGVTLTAGRDHEHPA